MYVDWLWHLVYGIENQGQCLGEIFIETTPANLLVDSSPEAVILFICLFSNICKIIKPECELKRERDGERERKTTLMGSISPTMFFFLLVCI
jgi:hypothetical protein